MILLRWTIHRCIIFLVMSWSISPSIQTLHYTHFCSVLHQNLLQFTKQEKILGILGSGHVLKCVKDAHPSLSEASITESRLRPASHLLRLGVEVMVMETHQLPSALSVTSRIPQWQVFIFSRCLGERSSERQQTLLSRHPSLLSPKRGETTASGGHAGSGGLPAMACDAWLV